MITKIDYPEDCIRIQRVLLEKGFEATLYDCQELWGEYCGLQDAVWLYLPADDEALLKILNETAILF